MHANGTSEENPLQTALYSKLRRRLLPFLFVLYVIAYLDRINVGFAALQMNRELGLSQAVFGFGAGIFFIGYFVLEVPSNLMLRRMGARLWISRIMLSWGVAAIAMMFTRGARSFYVLRFLLGAAEAGFFPGIILYLTWWFPAGQRARAVSTFMTATQIAGVIGGPLSGLLLGLNGVWNLSGGQWLFLAEGLPAVVLGFAVARYLPESPANARWLSAVEQKMLAANLALERESRKSSDTWVDALRSGRVWLLALLYFTLVFGHYGIALWLPQIVKDFGGFNDLMVGLLSSIPFLTAAVTMVLVGRHSDAHDERRWHLALAAFSGGLALVMSAAARGPMLTLLSISIAAAGLSSAAGPFWTLPASFLDDAAAASGIALINSFGNLAGFVGPSIIGLIRQNTNSFSGGLLAMAGVVMVGGAIALLFPELPGQRRGERHLAEAVSESP